MPRNLTLLLSACCLLSAASDSVLSAKEKKSIYHQGWIDFNKNGLKDIYEDPTADIDSRVADLLSQMTLEEKSCQLATLYGYKRVLKDSLPTAEWDNAIWKDGIANIDEQLNGVGNGYNIARELIVPFHNHVKALNATQRWFIEQTRLGIPAEFTNEGIHGLNHTWATPLPAPIAIGSTWNKQLVREAGHIAGAEAKLLGYHSVYAPILDLARDPRWGRCLECYGEDPYLVGTLGIEMSGGIQAEGVASGLKHYAAYSVPSGGRDADCRTDPHITPRELHEIFMRPFKMVIEQVHPKEVMASYNDWNGVPVIASPYFLTELLRKQYGFDGYVVSDSEAVEFVHTKHQVAETYEEAVRMVLEAGLNVRTHFTPPSDFILPIRNLLAQGRLDMATVDKRVAEVLKVKFQLGLFDHPLLDEKAKDLPIGPEFHQEFVDQMAEESMVLLKNANNLLPLDASQLQHVFVTGPLADESNFMASRYGPNGHMPVTVLAGLQQYLAGRCKVTYAKGCDIIDPEWPESELYPAVLSPDEQQQMQEAVRQTASADVIIAVMGEDEHRIGESRSRTSLNLPGHQLAYLQQLQTLGKPVVLVLINGHALTINWENRYLDAILETWFPHFQGGRIIAETLFGERNPSGKLSVTFPKSIGQIEWSFPYKKGARGAQYRLGNNGTGNTRVDGSLYPFGYGLSYTQFSYANMQVTPGAEIGECQVSVDVTNTGGRKGKEVIQLYISDQYSSVVGYESVLRGFEKIELEPGETRTVSFQLTGKDFEILGKDDQWVIEPGGFTLKVGSSSEDIRLSADYSIGL